jgi:hypothetical protein
MRPIWFITFALLVAASTRSNAQLEFNERPDPQTVKKIELKPDDARRMVNSFARCAGKMRKAKAELVLQMPYGAPEQGQAANKIIFAEDQCVRRYSGFVQLHFQSEALIGGMAEELALARYSPAATEHLAALTPEQISSSIAPRNGLEEFGQCIVLRDPSATHAFLSSDVATKEEVAAAATLVPHLEQCVAEGQTLALNRASLRNLLAVTLYRILSLTASAAR